MRVMRRVTNSRTPLQPHKTMLCINCLFLLASSGAICGFMATRYVEAGGYGSHTVYGRALVPAPVREVAPLVTKNVRRRSPSSVFSGVQLPLSKPSVRFRLLQNLDGSATQSVNAGEESRTHVSGVLSPENSAKNGPASSDEKVEYMTQNVSWIEKKVGFKTSPALRASNPRPFNGRLISAFQQTATARRSERKGVKRRKRKKEKGERKGVKRKKKKEKGAPSKKRRRKASSAVEAKGEEYTAESRRAREGPPQTPGRTGPSQSASVTQFLPGPSEKQRPVPSHPAHVLAPTTPLQKRSVLQPSVPATSSSLATGSTGGTFVPTAVPSKKTRGRLPTSSRTRPSQPLAASASIPSTALPPSPTPPPLAPGSSSPFPSSRLPPLLSPIPPSPPPPPLAPGSSSPFPPPRLPPLLSPIPPSPPSPPPTPEFSSPLPSPLPLEVSSMIPSSPLPSPLQPPVTPTLASSPSPPPPSPVIPTPIPPSPSPEPGPSGAPLPSATAEGSSIPSVTKATARTFPGEASAPPTKVRPVARVAPMRVENVKKPAPPSHTMPRELVQRPPAPVQPPFPFPTAYPGEVGIPRLGAPAGPQPTQPQAPAPMGLLRSLLLQPSTPLQPSVPPQPPAPTGMPAPLLFEPPAPSQLGLPPQPPVPPQVLVPRPLHVPAQVPALQGLPQGLPYAPPTFAGAPGASRIPPFAVRPPFVSIPQPPPIPRVHRPIPTYRLPPPPTVPAFRQLPPGQAPPVAHTNFERNLQGGRPPIPARQPGPSSERVRERLRELIRLRRQRDSSQSTD